MSLQMTIEMYPSDQVADLRAEVTHWYENLQKEQMNQQAQLQEFGQSGRQQGDFPGGLPRIIVLYSRSHSQEVLAVCFCELMCEGRLLSCRWFDGTGQDDLLWPRADHRLRREDSARAGLQRHAGDRLLSFFTSEHSWSKQKMFHIRK